MAAPRCDSASPSMHEPIEGVIDRVVCADNLELLRELPDGCCDLIYADPPFMTGRRFTGAAAAGFEDSFPGGIEEYLGFMRPRLEQMHRVLAERGTLYLHVDPRTSHYLKVLLDGLFGERQFLNEIIWSYRTGGPAGRRFPRKHDVLLAYARRFGAHKFNPIRSGSYRTDGIRLDEGGRPYKTTRRGRLYFHPDGPCVSDVWDIPFLSTVSSERAGFPTQKPLALLTRIITAATDPGDLVADFFCGSGTTLVAAKAAGRRWLGCDRESAATDLARQRLSDIDSGRS